MQWIDVPVRVTFEAPGGPKDMYSFALETNGPVSRLQARELLVAFIKVAEALGVSLGGEFHAPAQLGRGGTDG